LHLAIVALTKTTARSNGIKAIHLSAITAITAITAIKRGLKT
jgi:hypothetical protein